MKCKSIIASLIGFIVAIAAAISAYIYILRPKHLRWGATDEEVGGSFTGDELVAEPKLEATHAVSIQAAPAEVWPWLVQIGQGRGGFYSYDWIENMMGLDIQTADQILPEHQELEAGDLILLSPDGFGLPVAIVEPEKSLVLFGDTREAGPGEAPVLRPGDYLKASWGFYLVEQEDGSTRLVERFRADWNEEPYNTIFYRAFLEPGAFIMERKMLLGIKERAEKHARHLSEADLHP